MGKPLKVAEIRVRGLEGSITSKEVKKALALKGGCSPEAVRVREMRGAPGRAREGEMVWARLPFTSKVASTGSLAVG